MKRAHPSAPALRVSDHALVRFLDRAGVTGVEAVRVSLAASLERAALTADALDRTEYTVRADGLTYVVRNGVVVTVLG